MYKHRVEIQLAQLVRSRVTLLHPGLKVDNPQASTFTINSIHPANKGRTR
jgi:hypothetical protein